MICLLKFIDSSYKENKIHDLKKSFQNIKCSSDKISFFITFNDLFWKILQPTKRILFCFMLIILYFVSISLSLSQSCFTRNPPFKFTSLKSF